MKPRYRFAGRKPATEPGFSDRLVWENVDNTQDKIETSEWSFWRLWMYHPGNEAHRLHVNHEAWLNAEMARRCAEAKATP